MYEFLTDYT